ncbi:MAG: TonB-dependent receptor [Telluria sp.]
MNVQRTLLASAVLSALSSLSHAQSAPVAASEPVVVPKIIVTATPFGQSEKDQILSPTKILAGDELRDKLGSTLGETLSQELGVSASAFGAGASRPIIRGMEGTRVKMLENGMGVADVSGLSNDHAVSADGATARQIEILRGPAALLYGSGAIGGLVNVVNERIPVALEDHIGGQAEVRYSTVDKGRNGSASVDGAVGKIGFHVDGNVRRADDYKIPGYRVRGDSTSESGRLRRSFTEQDSLGAGVSTVGEWGHAGVSVSRMNNLYGIPTLEAPRVDMRQTRYDVDSLFKTPLAGLEQVKFKLGYTDYAHAELNDENEAEIRYTSRAFESRVEASHKPVAGWRGTFGVQTEHANFAGKAVEGGPDTVPATHSDTVAAFLVEERSFGKLRINAGVRGESVRREPEAGRSRKFDLGSYSVGAMFALAPGYSAGATVSVAQRAPTAEELYSAGPHEATETFDIGNPDFNKETSRNIELSLQKTEGMLGWKGNLFVNKVKDYVYGNINGVRMDEEGKPGDELSQRIFEQANVTIRGAEAELSWNQHGQGWLGRVFADTARGKLDRGGNLPLQSATRFGADVGYRSAALRAGLSLIRAQQQDRLAAFEDYVTPGYTQLNANLSYTQRFGKHDVTWFLLAKNLLDKDIRLSTSVLRDIAPLPGRNVVFGARTKF